MNSNFQTDFHLSCIVRKKLGSECEQANSERVSERLSPKLQRSTFFLHLSWFAFDIQGVVDFFLLILILLLFNRLLFTRTSIYMNEFDFIVILLQALGAQSCLFLYLFIRNNLIYIQVASSR